MMVEGDSEKVYFDRIARMSERYSIITKVSRDKRCADIILNCDKEARRLGLDDGDLRVAVFDLDVVDKNELKNACELAEKLGVLVMTSNLSFEIWLLIHLEDNPHVYTQEDYENRLSVLLGHRYRKSEGLKERANPDAVREAIKRGKRKLKDPSPIRCKDTPNSSTIWEITLMLLDE